MRLIRASRCLYSYAEGVQHIGYISGIFFKYSNALFCNSQVPDMSEHFKDIICQLFNIIIEIVAVFLTPKYGCIRQPNMPKLSCLDMSDLDKCWYTC